MPDDIQRRLLGLCDTLLPKTRGHVGRGTFVSAVPDASGAPFAWRGKVAAAASRSDAGGIRELMRYAADPGIISVAAGTPALEMFPIRSLPEADGARAPARRPPDVGTWSGRRHAGPS